MLRVHRHAGVEREGMNSKQWEYGAGYPDFPEKRKQLENLALEKALAWDRRKPRKKNIRKLHNEHLAMMKNAERAKQQERRGLIQTIAASRPVIPRLTFDL